jgi:hypothetical protein
MSSVNRTTRFCLARLLALARLSARGRLWLPAGAVMATLAWIPLSPATAGATPEISVSPHTISPTDQYLPTTHALAGQGAVVTVKVGPNKVLIPGYPVEVQECNAHPITGNDCDMLTTLTYDQLTKKPVSAKANGSVTVHFLVWSPLPNKWDPASVINVGPGHPTALWIGDDPSAWATTGFVTPALVVGQHKASSGLAASAKQGTEDGASSSGWSRIGGLVLVVLAVCGLGAGFTMVVRRRRWRHVAG